MEKNNLNKNTGLLFELKIGLNKDNAVVIDYGGKPVVKLREALKEYNSQANLCASIINHSTLLFISLFFCSMFLLHPSPPITEVFFSLSTLRLCCL